MGQYYENFINKINTREAALKGATILYTEMSPDLEWEDDFNHWYDTNHIPQRTKVEGFISARRYRDPDRPTYLAIYEITSEDVLSNSDYQKVRAQPNAKTAWMLSNVENYSRYVANEISDTKSENGDSNALDETFIFSEFFSVLDNKVDEFNQWYDREYTPTLMGCVNWRAVRRFEVIEGEPQPWSHLALHYISDSKTAFSSPEFENSRNSKTRLNLEQEPWFRGSSQLYRAIGKRFQT